MHEMEPFENAANFLEDVGMFEAAVHAPHKDLPELNIRKVLVVPDGSNQDPAVQTLGGAIAAKWSAVVDNRAGLRTAAEIEDACRAAGADLLVLPVPFGSDIGLLKEESLGEIVDRLLAARNGPILAVRQPLTEDELVGCLSNVLVTLVPGETGNPVGLAWACQLLKTGGELVVLEVADRDILLEARLLLEKTEIDDATVAATIERVLSRQFASLIAAVQRTAVDAGFGAQISSTGGRFVERVLAQVGDRPTLVVHAGSKDRRSINFHRSADLILGSRGPVLIV